MLDEITTAIGTPNIALVKYWGRRDDKLNLPMNSSVSMTLNESLNTRTSVVFSKRLNDDALYINGEPQDMKEKNEKALMTKSVLDGMRRLANINAHALIVSENSFPTSSGLASSASGAATLTFALSNSLGLGMKPRAISVLARAISGSACRSMFGGFVLWRKGSKSNGTDSYAEQIADAHYWPDVVDVIAIVSEGKKRVSSSLGHTLVVETSPLYRYRPAIAERNAKVMSRAISKRDFDTLARVTMLDSNDMHATCMDTFPPIFYMNEASREIVYAIHELNAAHGRNVAAYTFDAGPNAHIITTKRNTGQVKSALGGIAGVSRIIEAGQGSGPRLLKKKYALISDSLKPKLE